MPRFPFPDDIRDPDREGPNPFADDDAHEPKAPVVENVYASTTQPSVYEPKYDAILGSRYRLVFALGLVGLVFSVLGGLGTLLWQLAWMISMSSFYTGTMPLIILGLALSIPAWLFGRTDLRGVARSAMTADGHGLLRTGYFLGISGTMVGAAVLSFVICSAFFR